MILPVLYSLMKQNGFFFSNPPTASTWLCFHGPFFLSVCHGFPTSQASLPLESGDLALGDPLGDPQSSACHGLCLSLQKVSYCLHTPTPGAPWGNGGGQDLSCPREWEERSEEGKGPPSWKDTLDSSLLNLAPPFSPTPTLLCSQNIPRTLCEGWALPDPASVPFQDCVPA